MGKRQYEGGGSKGWGRGSMKEEVVKDGEEAV